MAQITIELSDAAVEEWAERARIGGHAGVGEAVSVWAECEAEPIDPAEVELLRERMAADPATDLTIDQVAAHFEAKYGVTLRRRGESL